MFKRTKKIEYCATNVILKFVENVRVLWLWNHKRKLQKEKLVDRNDTGEPNLESLKFGF